MITAIWISFKICVMIALAGLFFAKLVRPADAVWVKTKLLPLMCVLFAAGMILPSIWLLYLIVVIAIPFLARSRAEATAIYVVTALSLPRLYYQLGVGGAYIFEVDKWMMCAIGMAIAWVRFPAQGPAGVRWYDLPFLLVFILELVLARGQNLTSTLRTIAVDILCYALPYYLISRSFRRPEDLRCFLSGLLFVSFVLSFIAVYESRSGFLVYEAIAQHFGAADAGAGYVHQRSGLLRAHVTLGDATVFGVFLSRAFIAALPMRELFRTKRNWRIALGVLLLGIYATNARGAVLSLVIGLVAYDLYRRRYQSLALKIGAIALLYVAALGVAQVNSKVAERLGVAGSSVGTTDYRWMLYTRGMEEIRKHPFTGVSAEQTYADLVDLRQGEGFVDFVNGYIFYGMVTGYQGIVALVLCFVLTATRANSIRRRLRRAGGPTDVAAVVFSLALMALITCFTSGFGGRHEIIFYLFIGIGSALSAMKLRAAPPGESAPPEKAAQLQEHPAGASG